MIAMIKKTSDVIATNIKNSDVIIFPFILYDSSIENNYNDCNNSFQNS